MTAVPWGLLVVLEAERWLELRRFRALRASGASLSEIARETGLNWRTVKKYLEEDGPVAPPLPPLREGRNPRPLGQRSRRRALARQRLQ
jgi:transposase